MSGGVPCRDPSGLFVGIGLVYLNKHEDLLTLCVWVLVRYVAKHWV